MKKWVKAIIISVLSLGVVGTAGYFIGAKVTKDIRLSKATEYFVENLETNNEYHIKHLRFDFFDQQTSHIFGLKLSDVELEIAQDNNYNFKSDMVFTYDYVEIYQGSAVFLDNVFYLTTENSMLTTENISFEAETLKEFREVFNNTTLVDIDIFDFNFNLDIFDDFKDNVKEVKTEDPTTFLFEYPVKKRNSTIMFYSDSDFNISKMKTATALQYDDTLISIEASNISFADNVTITKPDDQFVNLNKILEGAKNLLVNFDIEKGKGISAYLGNQEINSPLLFNYKGKDIFGIYGTLNIYNKDEKNDFLFTFDGLIDIYYGQHRVNGEPIKVIVLDNVYYINIGKYLKGSIKSETLQKVFEINKEELNLQMRETLYNMVDLMGINRSFDENYTLLKQIEESDKGFTSTITFPVQKMTEINKDFTVSMEFLDDNISKVSVSDLSYNDVIISNIFMNFKDELSEKPEINPAEYKELDEIVENLINFN